MSIGRFALLPALVLACAPPMARAQGPCRDFRVEVRDAGTGRAVAGAQVRILRQRDGALEDAGATDSLGRYRTGGGGVDHYRVEATAPGYAPGQATTYCPSAGTGAATISLARAAGADSTSADEASWITLAADERVTISFDGANVRRIGASRHRLTLRWAYPGPRGGDDFEPHRYDRVEIQVEADCSARTWSNGDETLFLDGRVTHATTGLPMEPGEPAPGSIGERAFTELCKYLRI